MPTFPAFSDTTWPAPSPEVCELLRRGAEIALALPPESMKELDAARSPEFAGQSVAEDPVMFASARRIYRAGVVHWASANILHPGQPVPPYITPDMEHNARELARRGMAALMMSSARAVQTVAWRLWMQIAFQLTRDPSLLEELLDVSARSISAFIDANMLAMSAVVQEEREARQRDSHVERRELVTLILENGQVSAPSASNRLGYPLEQAHYGALIWSEAATPELHRLEEAAKALASSLSAPQPLIILAGPATLWVWCSGGTRVDRQYLEATLRTLPDVRIAMGSSGHGIDGFRRSHLEALTVQRVLGRLNAPAAVVSIEQIRLVALMTQDTKGARYFISQTLGELANASPTLQRSLRAFLQHGCNVTATADALHTHRNTLLRRLERAEALLPRPLADQRLDVGAALEVLAWTRPEADGTE
ncbi:PucR family transcriptional regulator [Paraburkholderia acidicola]|uniref:PucR family transcriptional regulator n=1 Tax=Paraburkholderia acidicola TaxID=1912599 RepID=UPI001A97925C|nr:helix-turn-helix domain-containing protein [Paraburkholderia acidicola]